MVKKFILTNYQRIKLIILIALVASLPFYLSLSSVLIILAVSLTFINAYSICWRGFYVINKLSLILLCYFIIETLWLGFTEKQNIPLGLFNLEKHLGLIFIPFIFFDFYLNPRDREKLFFTFIASCFFASIFCIVSNVYWSLHTYNTLFHEWRFSHERLSQPIGMHPVYFAMYLSLCILIALDYLKQKVTQFSYIKIALFFLLILYFLLIIISLGARTVSIAIILIIVINMVIYGVSKKRYAVVAIAGLMPVIFIGFVILNPVAKTRFMDMLKSNYEDTSYGSYFARFKIWKPGLEVIKENFCLGVGTGDAQKELDKKFIQYNYIEGTGMDMHNQYLQILLEVGVVGLFIYVSMLCIQIRNSIKQKNLLYLSFLLLFIIGSITESMFCRQNGIIYFLFFSFIFYKSNLNIDIVK